MSRFFIVIASWHSDIFAAKAGIYFFIINNLLWLHPEMNNCWKIKMIC